MMVDPSGCFMNWIPRKESPFVSRVLLHAGDKSGHAFHLVAEDVSVINEYADVSNFRVGDAVELARIKLGLRVSFPFETVSVVLIPQAASQKRGDHKELCGCDSAVRVEVRICPRCYHQASL